MFVESSYNHNLVSKPYFKFNVTKETILKLIFVFILKN